jgi:hypothetical protein
MKKRLSVLAALGLLVLIGCGDAGDSGFSSETARPASFELAQSGWGQNLTFNLSRQKPGSHLVWRLERASFLSMMKQDLMKLLPIF